MNRNPTREIRRSMIALSLVLCGCTATGVASTASLTPSPGLSAPQAPSSSAQTAPSSGTADIEGSFDVGGFKLRITCRGTGTPTVVFEAGLGGGNEQWLSIAPSVAKTTRVCTYDRAGIGGSEQRPGWPTTSAGAMADELSRLLDSAGVDGPLVFVGFSYGGMIARLAAHRHRDRVVGLVLVDASSGHQFEGDWLLNDKAWRDGSTVIDRETSANELAAVKSLGSIPLVVLTEGRMGGQFEIDWSRFQDELATLSSKVLHIVARDSTHFIPKEAPELVVEAVTAAVASVRGAQPLQACGELFTSVGGECLASTMTAQLEGWDRLRAAVVPTVGKLPPGRYSSELNGAAEAVVNGKPSDFKSRVFTWVIAHGRWSVSIVTDGGTPEGFADVYASSDDVVTLRIPIDWRIPRTPGVNRLRWTVDAKGTIRLEQIDHELRDDTFAAPLIRVGDAPSG